MKKTVLLLLVLLSSSLFAQNYVTIPDANFVKYLKEVVPNAMNGDQLNTFSPDVNNLKVINAEGRAINNLEGIQYFSSLETLDIGNGYLTLEKDKNKISSLPTLPMGLKELICGYISLDSLPLLPSGLENLSCYSNNLKFLPTLPDSIRKLYCFSNQLTSLPKLPKNLTTIDCSENQLTEMPQLPTSLVSLIFKYNNIKDVPELPKSLLILNCGRNNIETLPELPKSLICLQCVDNKLTKLPDLPDTLSWLEVDGNINLIIPKLNKYLDYFSCASTNLFELPILNDSLKCLMCSSNNLNYLPTLPTNLKKLDCRANNISCLPLLPSTITEDPIFTRYSGLGTAGFLIRDNPLKCLPNYISVMDSITLSMPLCSENDSINNPFQCQNAEFGIIGSTNLDINKNCKKEYDETGISNIQITLLDNANNPISKTYSALNGIYQFPVGANTYKVQIDTTNLPFITPCLNGTDTTVTLNNTTNFAKNVNFNFTCKDGFDVGIRSVATYGVVFPGQVHELQIAAGDMSNWYKQHCAAGISGELQLIINGPVSYIGNVLGALTPTIEGNKYTYVIPDFANINFKTAFGLSFVTDTTAKAGDQICVSAHITPKNGDYNQANNSYDYCYSVINSHDPNLKEVYPANFKPGYDGYLTYTVHFQNTGSAQAFNIRLVDTLDAKLDLKTFEVLNYSHANTVSLTGNVMRVKYPNIMLADSTTNEKASHGFIQYRIKPLAPISEEQQIKNTAYIYFDYNEAVVTNTTTSKASKSLGLKEEKELGLRVYPNPTENLLTFERTNNGLNSVEVSIVSINGQVLHTTTLDLTNKQTIDLSDYSPGVYFVNVHNDESADVIKVIKK